MANNFDFCGPGRKGTGSLEYNARIGGIDNDGNIYVATFSWPGSKEVWSAYNIAKVDRMGNLTWSLLMNEYNHGRICTDLQGNTFIAAFDKVACVDKSGHKTWEVNTAGFRGYGDVFLTDGGFYVNGGEKSGDTIRTFIAKFSSAGQLLSIRYDHQDGIAFIDGYGNGYFTNTTEDFDPLTGNSAKLWKYDNKGKLLFEKFIPHTPTNIKSDPFGNVFVKGDMHPGGTLNINGTIYSLPQQPSTVGHFIIKYNPAGDYLWHKIATGHLGTNDIAVDSLGSLYYSTGYGVSFDFNEEVVHKNASREADIVTIKLDPDGLILWSITSNAQAEGVNSQPHRIKVNGDDVYICGWTETNALFGPFAIKSFDSDLLVARINQYKVVGFSESVSEKTSLHIYPNPSADRFTVSWSNGPVLPTIYTVKDALGRIILLHNASHPGQNFEIDLSSQCKGIYFLEVRAENYHEVRKLITY